MDVERSTGEIADVADVGGPLTGEALRDAARIQTDDMLQLGEKLGVPASELLLVHARGMAIEECLDGNPGAIVELNNIVRRRVGEDEVL